MTARPLQFEFLDVQTQTNADPTVSADFKAGYAAGIEAAGQEHAAQQLRKVEEALQVLSDMAFTYAEARSSILSALGPLFRAMIDKLVPAMARDSLAPQVVDALLALATQGADHPIELRIHPSHLPVIDDLVRASPSLNLRVVGDESLGPLIAEWRTPAAASLLDLAELSEAIRTGLAALIDSPERKNRHASHA